MTLPGEVTIRDDPGCAARRLRLWRDVVGDHMADVDLTPAGDLPKALALRGSLSLRAYRGTTVARIAAGAQSLHRTRERIRRSGSDMVFVTIVTSGSCQLEQHGRRARIAAGGLCLYDTAAPYSIETSFDFSSVLVGATEAAFGRRVGDIRSAAGPVAPGPASTVASRYWRALADGVGDMDRDTAEQLIESGLDVVATAIRAGSGRIADSFDTSAVLERARRAIRQGHAAPSFTVADVARAAGVSLRRLQELFQIGGDTISAALLRARLDHARRMLADPELRRLPVKELMSRAGFHDPSQFSRAFKRAYTVGPNAFRTSRTAGAEI